MQQCSYSTFSISKFLTRDGTLKWGKKNSAVIKEISKKNVTLISRRRRGMAKSVGEKAISWTTMGKRERIWILIVIIILMENEEGVGQSPARFFNRAGGGGIGRHVALRGSGCGVLENGVVDGLEFFIGKGTVQIVGFLCKWSGWSHSWRGSLRVEDRKERERKIS